MTNSYVNCDRRNLLEANPEREDVQTKLNPKKKRGRPSVIELKGDPELEKKALRLRRDGMSWTQISDKLDVSRTTARRLCQKAQNAQRGQSHGRMKE